MGFDVQIDGAGDLAGALRALVARTRTGTEAALSEGAVMVQDEIQGNLMRRSYPPSSPVGEPPAYRTGLLHDRVLRRVDGEVDAGVFQARVYPSVIYARIQELGGFAGRGHRSHLLPRPYVRPAVEAVQDRVLQGFVNEWRRAAGG